MCLAAALCIRDCSPTNTRAVDRRALLKALLTERTPTGNSLLLCAASAGAAELMAPLLASTHGARQARDACE